ncbi:anthranilate synthase component I [Intestinibacillus sp. Marseille-P6563]|uniref:anthranilate synthase component I n=1 Tax=Intestinibacillus sp. Marseille-P6563 TaxID=2364792 RepID=UPI000F069FE3|nr:anthranilate synthase component I [Intestinibacillus sp. Marseille-P6563]
MYPTFEQAKDLANQGFRRIPVSREMYADRFTPTEVMRVLKHVSRHCFILESAEDARQWGRYTFLGFDPTAELTCKGGKLRIRAGAEFTETVQHPGDAIRRLLADNRSPRLEGLPPFTGGLVGYFSYSYIGYAEPSLHLTREDGTFQDVDLMLFDKVIAFDNLRQKIILIAGARADDIETSYHKAAYELDQLANLIRTGVKAEPQPPHLKAPLTPQFTREEYGDMIRKAQHYIHEGDIFQVVLSNPLEAEMDGSLFDVYRVLRTTNPSPYMFYFSSDDIEIAGASPETLAKLTDGKLFTFPLAGTRPRGATEAQDQALERELLADEKELAEHNMLVDLGRNDIGRISKLGSVQVEKYLQIERFSHVMHIGSTVTGQIRDDRDAIDAVDAILPAGTLSGAPKLRACQIIDELEGHERGIYGGAVGYLDFTGNLDTCIAIRLAYKKNGRVCVRSGAGIVADSVPDSEYQECLNKAAAVVRAIQTAQEGIDQ